MLFVVVVVVVVVGHVFSSQFTILAELGNQQLAQIDVYCIFIVLNLIKYELTSSCDLFKIIQTFRSKYRRKVSFRSDSLFHVIVLFGTGVSVEAKGEKRKM